jgi:lipid-A-disaccharide synthase
MVKKQVVRKKVEAKSKVKAKAKSTTKAKAITKTKSLKIFVIAGEVSGDILGGKLISSIKRLAKGTKIEFIGIGGEKMEAEGLDSIFPMDELSVMGIMEVLPHISKLLKRINQTARVIYKAKPDVVITIDSPDFNFRVIKKLHQLDKKDEIKKVHMIAPSVWAYRAGRAKKIARLYHLLLSILPFENQYFEKHGLPTKFIGHPIVEDEINKKKLMSRSEFCKRYHLPEKNDIICLTPGRRMGEVRRLLPIFVDAVRILNKKYKNLSIAIPTTYKVEDLVRRRVKNLDISTAVVKYADDKQSLYALSRAGIAKSGTNTFELMMTKMPIVVAYKFNWLTGIIGKIIIKVKYCNLVNIILGRELIPEFVQNNCKAELIANGLGKLISDKKLAEKQISEVRTVLKGLGMGNKEKSSDIAAKAVLGLLARK